MISTCLCQLLCKKFEYPVGGDINYPAFIQAVDSEYIGTATTLSDFSNDRYWWERKVGKEAGKDGREEGRERTRKEGTEENKIQKKKRVPR